MSTSISLKVSLAPAKSPICCGPVVHVFLIIPSTTDLNHVVSPGVEEQEGILKLRHLVLGEGGFLRHLRAWMETGEPGTGTQRREERRTTEGRITSWGGNAPTVLHQEIL